MNKKLIKHASREYQRKLPKSNEPYDAAVGARAPRGILLLEIPLGTDALAVAPAHADLGAVTGAEGVELLAEAGRAARFRLCAAEAEALDPAADQLGRGVTAPRGVRTLGEVRGIMGTSPSRRSRQTQLPRHGWLLHLDIAF